MNKPYLHLSLPSCFSLVLLAAVLTGCGKEAPAPVAEETPLKDPNIVIVSQQLATLIKVDTASEGTVNDMIRIPGRMEADAQKTARIGAPIAGRITQIRAQPGDQVKTGMTLAELNSPELGNAQLALLKAHSAEQLALRAVERAEVLLKSDVIGSAELLRRQSELSVASAEKRAAVDQLRVLGVSQVAINQLLNSGAITSNAPITATLSGTILERRVAQGQVVQPADVLFVISDLSTIWAVAEVPEQEASLVSKGQKIVIEVPALSDGQRDGKVTYISDVVSPDTRTVRVVALLDNPDRLLKPAMLSTMLIEGHGRKVPLIPSTAVVRENNQDAIFVEVGSSQYKLMPVRLGTDHNGKRPLLESLPDGQRIVIEGAFHLNNERNRINLGGQE
ncbi:efflux RND transporter periplasmic adaptor subunit [Ampullimonas aquatilis]|uniref:efflux RND transporter periplasmic adaptor subunit n=1 Tax=Ampullimonas aquatilis TaxID=1341549 RepID=UPI003C7755C7